MTIVEMDEGAARRLTLQIAALVGDVVESYDTLRGLIVEAYETRAWLALGYESWDAYVDAEIETDRLRLDRGERQRFVISLRSAGMSTRAIAPAVGASQKTVDRDIRAASESDDSDEPMATVTSLDGRRRPATKPTHHPCAEPAAEYAEVRVDASLDLAMVMGSLDLIRDRFGAIGGLILNFLGQDVKSSTGYVWVLQATSDEEEATWRDEVEQAERVASEYAALVAQAASTVGELTQALPNMMAGGA